MAAAPDAGVARTFDEHVDSEANAGYEGEDHGGVDQGLREVEGEGHPNPREHDPRQLGCRRGDE